MRSSGTLRLITQPDHAALAGDIAQRWGNARFDPPDPFDSVLLAARAHDDGWATLDDVPAYSADERRPAHFLEIPLPESIRHYGPGVDAVYDADLYAGALVGMHWAGLYSARWGVQSSPPLEHPAAVEVVAEQERRRTEAARRLWGFSGLRSAFEARLWHNYELLQALDLLSLALCTMPLDVDDPEAAAVPVPATLRALEQEPGARVVPAVPERAGGDHVDLTLRVVAPNVVSVSPYPFHPESIDVEVPYRSLTDRAYDTSEEAASAYHGQEPGVLRATLVAA